MIKLFASLFMLIDHIGMILFPQEYVLRIIGRLSMPLFAFCIARGFYFSEQKGTTAKYARNLLLFSVISQVPFTALFLWNKDAFSLNIGFTWLLSLILMKVLMSVKRPLVLSGVCVLIVLVAIAVPMDYRLCGVLYPSIFYFFMYRMNKPQYAFVGMSALYAVFVLLGGGQIQFFSIAAFPVLMVVKRNDGKIAIPRRFFYWFYPLHISVLIVIKGVLALWG